MQKRIDYYFERNWWICSSDTYRHFIELLSFHFLLFLWIIMKIRRNSKIIYASINWGNLIMVKLLWGNPGLRHLMVFILSIRNLTWLIFQIPLIWSRSNGKIDFLYYCRRKNFTLRAKFHYRRCHRNVLINKEQQNGSHIVGASFFR